MELASIIEKQTKLYKSPSLVEVDPIVTKVQPFEKKTLCPDDQTFLC